MKEEFKLIVAGGRDFNDYKLMVNYLDKVLANKLKEAYDIIIISGTAKGADSLGRALCQR